MWDEDVRGDHKMGCMERYDEKLDKDGDGKCCESGGKRGKRMDDLMRCSIVY
jgi:hypothetical protein